jgi:hypothetical protein
MLDLIYGQFTKQDDHTSQVRWVAEGFPSLLPLRVQAFWQHERDYQSFSHLLSVTS